MTDETGAGSVDAGISEIESVMGSDFGAYQRDPGMQRRYGELLATRAAAAVPADASAADVEISKIEDCIRSDNRGYQADPTMQARYLELLGERNREAVSPSPDVAKPGQPAAKEPAPAVEPTPGVNVTAHHIDTAIANFEAEPETAALLKSWGADARDNIRYATVESNEILNGLAPEAARTLFDAVEDLPLADYAKLMRHLSDAGRARKTR